MKKQGDNFYQGKLSVFKLLIVCFVVLSFAEVPQSTAQYSGTRHYHTDRAAHNRYVDQRRTEMARSVAPSLSLSPQSSFMKPQGYNPRAVSMYNQGLTKHKQGRIRDAIAYYQRALAIDPNIRDLQYNLGLAYLSEKRYTDAEHSFSQVLRINPSDSQALSQLDVIAREKNGTSYQSSSGKRIASSTGSSYRDRMRAGMESFRKAQNSYARRRNGRQDIRSPYSRRGKAQDIRSPKVRAHDIPSPYLRSSSRQQDIPSPYLRSSRTYQQNNYTKPENAKPTYQRPIATPKPPPVSFPAKENSSISSPVSAVNQSTPPIAKPVENKSNLSETVPSTNKKVDTKVGDKWALVICISKFKNSKYDLVYAAKDAKDFYNFLVNEANFKRDHVKLLLDQQATRAKIMGAFGSSWLPRMTEPGDLVVVYVSTHGTPKDVDNGGRNYIVAHDTDAEDLYPTGVDMDEIYRRIKEGVKTDRVLIVLDTCYSGSAIPGSRALVRNTNFDLSQVKLGRGHLVISSSSPGERSWESKRYQNGVFTHQLIDALRAKNKTIDVKEAFEKMRKKVTWEVKCDYGKKQNPQFGGDWKGSDLILSVPPSNPRSLGPQSN